VTSRLSSSGSSIPGSVSGSVSGSVVVLAGGVGAARYLRHLLTVHPANSVTAIVNTGDDTVFHGLHVSPDIDTVTYTVSGAIDNQRGWGLGGETWVAMENLRRYEPYEALTWFNLGDRDLATHLWRTSRLRAGATLAEVCADQALAWELGLSLLPMTNDPVATKVQTPLGRLDFQEYFVRHQHGLDVSEITFDGIASATPAPGVLEAIAAADRIVIAPSNPLVSIGPVLAVDGIRGALAARRDDVVAISPIIGGAALKGPADRMLTTLGHASSCVGVASLYADIAATMIIDTVDASFADAVQAAGVRAVVCDSIMSEPGVGATLARATLQSL
jgi:LPPG:FO 2-phospho-L-lactate transferase